MPSRAVGPVVFLVSAAVLAFQVVLLRLFAVETFHHFAYMVVGVALLGFGSSGTALILARRWTRGREAALFDLAAALFPVALAGAVLLARTLEFEPTQLLWDRGQWLLLAALYAVLSVPFFLAATAVMVALEEAGEAVGRIYAWNMVGSGAGSALALGFLALDRPDRALGGVLALAVVGGVVALLARGRGRPRAGAAALLLALGVVGLARAPWTLEVNPFKGLPQVEAQPGAERVAEAWSPTGWVTAIRSPSFHHAPGLSLGYRGELPDQVALFVDGETAGAATRWTAAGDEADPARAPSLAFLDWLPTAAAYVVGRPGSVLVLGSAGGLEVLGALRHGADSVTGVELVGPLVEVTGWVLGEGADLYRRRGVRPVVGDARAFAAEAEERFDVVVLPPAGRFGVAAAGVYAAGEDYMSTVEAFADYLERLAPGGVLAVTGWLRTPPRNGAKTLLTAVRALRLAGVEEPGGSLVFLRSWATGTLLVKPDGFAPEELDRVRAFALERRVDVDWPPPPEGAEPPTFNRMERPVFRQAAAAAAAGPDSARAWAARYPFHVAPATDDRPYAHRFLRLSSLPELLSRGRGAMLPVAEWGYLAVVATLFQSGLLAALLLLVPAAVLVARRGDGPPLDGTRSGLARTAGYFGAIGLGFALVEITAIQRLGLVLGHPVYATSAALAALLAFSGLGSWASDRWEAGRGARACLAVGIGALVGAALIPRAGVLLPLPFGARMTLGGVAVGGLGFLMGWPFPTGLRRLAGRGAPVAWAWAANGFASVVGVSLATLLAMELGGGAVLGVAGGCYLLAAVLLPRG